MQKNCILSALNRVFNPIIISAEYYYKMAIQKEQCNGIKSCLSLRGFLWSC